MGQRTDVIIPSGVSYTTYDDGKTRQDLGSPERSGSTSNYTNIDAINASGVPITSGQASAGSLDTTIFGGANFEDYKNFILENTDKNNAWSAKQAQDQMAFQERMMQIANEFNSKEASRNRSWQQYMSNSAHQREVADLKAAGLNPILSASGGNGAAVTSGATASSVGAPSGAKGDTDTSANSAITNMASGLISAKAQMANANLSARTNLQIAEKQQEMQLAIAKMQAGVQYASMQNAYKIAELQAQNAYEMNTNNPAYFLIDLAKNGGSSVPDPTVTSGRMVYPSDVLPMAKQGLQKAAYDLKQGMTYAPEGYIGKHPVRRAS